MGFFLICVIDKVVSYFPFFIKTCTWNVFEVTYRTDGMGVKFILIIADIPFEIVYICHYK